MLSKILCPKWVLGTYLPLESIYQRYFSDCAFDCAHTTSKETFAIVDESSGQVGSQSGFLWAINVGEIGLLAHFERHTVNNSIQIQQATVINLCQEHRLQLIPCRPDCAGSSLQAALAPGPSSGSELAQEQRPQPPARLSSVSRLSR